MFTNQLRRLDLSNFKDNMLVPLKWAGQDKRFADGLKENLDIICGHRGDPLDRAITARDLLDSGIAKLPAGSTAFSGSSRELTPPDKIPYLITPPAPTNLQASGAFQNILLNWDLTLYIGHAHIEIWRNTSDNIAAAAMLATTTQSTGTYADNVGSGSSFYYWVRAVNENGLSGPFNGSTGTLGQTAPDVAFLINTLSNAITSSELASSLSTQLSTYQTANQVSGTVGTAVAGVRGKIPTWVASGTYAVNDVVRDAGGKLYVCLIAVTAGTSDTLPTTFAAPTTNWKLYGDIARTEDSASKITQLNLLDGNSSSAAAQSIHGLNSILKDSDGNAVVSSTNLSTMKTNVLNSDGTARATATQIDYLSSSYTNPTTGVADNVTLQAALNTSASSVNGLNAQYSVKIDNKGHVTGFGLSSTTSATGPTSAFIIRADRFAVIDPASTADGIAADGTGTVTPTAANVPFFIDSGVTYIKAAAIKDASITSAKIGSVNANTIATGTLSANFISGGTIDASAVNIVGTGGTLNIKSSASGARMELSGSTIRVFDAQGTVRVKLGAL